MTASLKKSAWTHGRVGIALSVALLIGAYAGGALVSSDDDDSHKSGDTAAAAAEPAGHAHGPADSDGHGSEPAGGDEAEETIWTCSMDPQVRMKEFGKCPICGMDLIPVKATSGPSRVEMTEDARRLAGIETIAAIRKDVSVPLHVVGKVAFDETAVARIAARFGGRLDRMFVDYEGTQVRKGDHLYQIYSPDLWVAQEELIQAERALSKLPSGTSDTLRDAVAQGARAAREKLKLWELRNWQIRQIARTRKKTKRVTIYAPVGGVVLKKSADEGAYVKEGQPVYTIADLSRVWVLLDVYESDVQWVKWGQRVRFEVAAYPGKTFEGKVAFVSPTMNPKTRTVQVRLTVDNAGGALKPEMFVRAKMSVAARGGVQTTKGLAGKYISPMHPEVMSDEPGTCSVCGMKLVPAEEHWLVGPSLKAGGNAVTPLVVPITAPLITGRRAVVFVEVEGAETPTYMLREVVLGPRAGDWYIVKDGLMEGERVVVEGAFKLDSALQIRGDQSMMTLDPKGAQGAGPEAAKRPNVADAADAIAPAGADPVGEAAKALTAVRGSLESKDIAALHEAAVKLSDVAQKDASLHLLRGPASWLQAIAKGAQGASAKDKRWRDIGAATREVWTLGVSIQSLKLPVVEDMEPPENKRFAKALKEAAETASAMSVALAADDFEAASQRTSKLAKALVQLEKSKRPVSPGMLVAGEALGDAKDIEALRNAFGDVSAALVSLVEVHRQLIDAPVQRSYCPMAFKDHGAFWLEPKGKLANPYFGAQMLGCGTVGTVYER